MSHPTERDTVVPLPPPTRSRTNLRFAFIQSKGKDMDKKEDKRKEEAIAAIETSSVASTSPSLPANVPTSYDGAVTQREEEGRWMSRIRSRSRPTTPPTTTNELLHDSPPIASGSQLPYPTLIIQSATPQKSKPHQVERSHSIPQLHPRSSHSNLTTSTRSAPENSTNGLGIMLHPSVRRMASSGALRGEKGGERTSWRSRSGSSASSSEGDVLGRLLWNEDQSSREARGRNVTDLTPESKQYLSVSAETKSEPATALPRRRSHSPFGSQVRVPRYRQSYSPPRISSTSPVDEMSTKARSMREAASTETIRVSTSLSLEHLPLPAPFLPRFDDPSIFDDFQSNDVIDFRLHSISSSPSFASFHSDQSKPTAHQITVSTAPGDDPRFVIYGTRRTTTTTAIISPTTMNFTTARRPSVQEEWGSQAGSPMTATSSTRWSIKDPRSMMSGVAIGSSSPATSLRNSVDSLGGGGGGAPKPMASTSVTSLTSSSSVGGGESKSTRSLMAATVERWIAELTSKIEPELLTGFFLTYRSFVRPVDLCRLLITRFTWAMSPTSSPEDDAGRRIVRVRTFVVLRHWLLNHFADDFVPDRLLRSTLTEWLNVSGRDEEYRASPKDLRLIKGLKKLVRRLKEMYVAISQEERMLNEEKMDYLRVVEVGGRRSAELARSDEDLDFELHRPPTSLQPPSSTSTSTSVSTPTATTPLGGSIRTPRPSTATPTAALDLHSSFPLPNEQNPISRTFTSALGSIGRFKRMISNRSLGIPQAMRRGKSIEAFDALEFGTGTKTDLLYVKGGVERYLAYFNIDGENTTGERVEVLQAEEEKREEQEMSGLGIDLSSSVDESSPPVLPKSTKSHPTIRKVLSRFSLTASLDSNHHRPVPITTTNYDYMDQASSLLFFQRPPSARIELDDIDLSDEDDDVVEVKRTLKRLPPAATTTFRLPTVERRSIETVSSYGSPLKVYEPMSLGNEQADEGRLREGTQRVENFILEGMDDSDDDEPGDVEAALRRLEGQIDEGKQREKMMKVEKQMDKSLQLEKYRSLLAATTTDEMLLAEEYDVDEVGDETVSSIASTTLDPEPVITTVPLPEIISPSLPVAPISSDIPPRASHLAPKDLQRLSQPRSISRKPSLRDFFSSRPASTTIPKPIPPTHRSFLLFSRTEILARQFALIERDLFRVVSWQELVNDAWGEEPMIEIFDWELYLKERRKEEGMKKEARTWERTREDVRAVVGRWNLMANWVCSEIVLTTQLDERVALIAKFIRLAFKCYRQSNFQTLTQIIHGIQLPAIARLTKTWSKVPKWEMREFKGLKTFVSDLNDFKHLRFVTDSLVEEWGPAGRSSIPVPMSPMNKSTVSGSVPSGCVPFFGLFLRDLSTTFELPTFLDPTAPNVHAIVNAMGSLESIADPEAFNDLPPLREERELQPLVNVHKFRMMSSIIQRLLALQEFSQIIQFEPEPATYFKCLKIRALDSETMMECSLRLEA